MARKTIFVSDLSGESLDEASAAKVAITCNGDRYELETNALMGMGGFTQDFVKALERAQAPKDDQAEA